MAYLRQWKVLGAALTPCHQVWEILPLLVPPLLKIQHDLLVLRLIVVPEPKIDNDYVPRLSYAMQAGHELRHEVLC